MLALEGYEMLSTVLILIELFIWGPNKLPEKAKAIGEAKEGIREGRERGLHLCPRKCSQRTQLRRIQLPPQPRALGS
jgi:hypothetical protein